MNPVTKIGDSSLWDRLAFWTLLGSGAFVVLLWSPNVLGKHCSSWVKLLIFTLPWIMLWPVYSFEVIKNKTHRIEIILMGTILILGGVNVICSDNVSRSYPAMRLFLLSGIPALWASMFLVTDRYRRHGFDWFCCGCLAIAAPTEIIAYMAKGATDPGLIDVFTLNPIPVGTLIILLSPGPVHLWLSGSRKLKLVGGGLLLLGGILILLTEKRGTFLAVAAMILVWMFYQRFRFRYLVAIPLLAIALLIPFRGLSTYKSLDPSIPSHFTILHRLELYPFALHIYQKHPLLGIGLRPFTHENYLVDYQPRNQDLTDFAPTVKRLQTFDNLLVTAFVELGTLMALAYLGLVIFIITRYCFKVRPFAEADRENFFRLLPLLGLAIHSMFYDSLLFPPINWLFHVQLGILAAFSGKSLVGEQQVESVRSDV